VNKLKSKKIKQKKNETLDGNVRKHQR